MQEAIIVVYGSNNGNSESLDTLNKKLTQGWKVISSCSMPSSCAMVVSLGSRIIDHYPTCLVIIEKDCGGNRSF